MIGGILLKIAFVSAVVSLLGYAQHHRKGTDRSLFIGRALYHSTVVAVILSSATLLYAILTHQFQYTYVWSYSSRALSTPLLISTFYAGQEGSFLLWALFTALIGVFLMRHSSRYGYEAQVMSVFTGIELMLLLMLLVKNPFLYVWESFAGEVQPGFMPADGRGLNPLLQNYWMVIHPQVLFSGFAAMGVPYAYAMAALLKRDYDYWFKPATPWIVFGILVLGLGIMMGGFWAYETLGWGGYWAWDPVENSSLVPWLIGVAAIHTIMSQRKSGAFARTNLVLGMLCFILVLYSTFLTRSGVLGDTSVHSFVDPGMWAYWLLVLMMLIAVAAPIILFVRRWKEIPSRPAKHDYYSREFALFLGSAALVFVALFVIVGTSSPMLSDLLYGKKSAVDISYYATTTLPLGIAMGLLMGFGQLLWWTRSDRKAFRRALALPLILAHVAMLGFVALGVHGLLLLSFLFAATFALLVNLRVGWTIVKGNPKLAGGAVAHIGVAVMFFGFIASSEYDGTQTVSLPQGTTVETLGYRLTYEGYDVREGERHAFNVLVEKDGQSFHLAPVMYFSSYNEGVMRHPDIANLYLRDFYLAPLGLEEPASRGGTSGVSIDTLVVEASVKPLINLVWTGVIILLVGFGVTIVRRGEETAGRGRRAPGLRSGVPENPDAEQVHQLAAEPGGAPEQHDAGAVQKKIETR